MANENYDLSYLASRYRLTEKSLMDITDWFKNNYGLNVRDIIENKNGYLFVGDYGIPIGEITFNRVKGDYNNPVCHMGAKERIMEERAIRQERKREQQRKKFRLQKGVRIGVALTAASVIALSALGVIKPLDVFKGKPQTVAVATDVNSQISMADANDLILVEWADYTMGRISEICADSEYEQFESFREIAYSDYFAKAMGSYYNYVDYLDTPIPEDIIAESKVGARNNFRSEIMAFNDYLNNSVAFSNETFEKSPFAQAVIVDDLGNILEDENGRVILADGKEAVFAEGGYSVYVRALDADYSITELPDDAIIKDGVVYVDQSHLKEQENRMTK